MGNGVALAVGETVGVVVMVLSGVALGVYVLWPLGNGVYVGISVGVPVTGTGVLVAVLLGLMVGVLVGGTHVATVIASMDMLPPPPVPCPICKVIRLSVK